VLGVGKNARLNRLQGFGNLYPIELRIFYHPDRGKA